MPRVVPYDQMWNDLDEVDERVMMNDTPQAPEQPEDSNGTAPGASPDSDAPQPEAPAAPEAQQAPERPQAPQAPRYAPPRYAPPVQPQQLPPQYSSPQYAQPQYSQPAAPPPFAPPAPGAPGASGAPGAPGTPGAPWNPYAPPVSSPYSTPYAQQPAPSYPPYTVLGTPGPGEPFDGAADPGDLSRPLYGANMGQAIARFFKNYAMFSGRASRTEFWWVVLAIYGSWFALAFIAGILDSVSYRASYEMYSAYSAVSTLLGFVVLVVLLGTLIPMLAITWRRLHDANLPGPFYFLAFIPGFGGIVLIVLLALPPKVEGRRFVRGF